MIICEMNESVFTIPIDDCILIIYLNYYAQYFDWPYCVLPLEHLYKMMKTFSLYVTVTSNYSLNTL
jgi:hypothetical protein